MEKGSGSSHRDDTSAHNASAAALPHVSPNCSIGHAWTTPEVLNCVQNCSQCKSDSPVALGDAASFPSNNAASDVVDGAMLTGTILRCTACYIEPIATARCFECVHLLCRSCEKAHHFMYTFEGHRVLSLRELQNARDGLSTLQDVTCSRHRSSTLRYFCHSCDWPVCEECAQLEHPRAMHNLVLLSESAPQHAGNLPNLLDWVVLDPETRRPEPPWSGHHPSPPVASACGSNAPSKCMSSTKQLGPLLTSFAYMSPQENLSRSGGEILCANASLGAPQDVPAPPPYSTQAKQPFKYQASFALRQCVLKPEVKRKQITYYFRFGGFGYTKGQFAELSGVAVNTQNDIVVADASIRRIQIFDQQFRFKRQFMKSVKRGGQMSCPIRVAVVRQSNDIVLAECLPSHQIQIFNQQGQFVRKFGGMILRNPRGVAVDGEGRVVVVDSKALRVVIFDQSGTVLRKFECSNQLQFPNCVAVNNREIFISDNWAHCVKVFSYGGAFLRQIGGDGLTDYPVAVRINSRGEVVVADNNNNNFHVTVFTQDGLLMNALESLSTHARCFDIALMDNGSVVVACKDCCLYVYHYEQLSAVAF